MRFLQKILRLQIDISMFSPKNFFGTRHALIFKSSVIRLKREMHPDQGIQKQYCQKRNERRKSMFKNYGLFFMSMMVYCMSFMVLPAMSQESYMPQGQPPGVTESQSQISDAELTKAAAAYSKINSISEEFQKSLQNTTDQKERQQLQEHVNQRMVKAVQDSGLDVQTYNDIMVQVRSNTNLNERFQKKIQSMP